MNSFYEFHLKETDESREAKKAGRPFGKAEALRQAMLVAKKTYPANVQIWGSFFLQGLPD